MTRFQQATWAVAAFLAVGTVWAQVAIPQRSAAKPVRPQVTIDDAQFNRTFSHSYATVNGIRLHYVMGGSGPAVVLLHGWPTTWYMWRSTMQRLAGGYTVVALDLPGSGDSDKPESGYDKKTMAQVIHGLMQALGYNSYNVIGHDIGGMVGYALAAIHPESVLRFAILDVTPPGLLGWTEQRLDPRAWHFAFFGRRDVPELLVTGRERPFLASFYDEHAYNPDAISEHDVNYYAKIYAEPGNLRGGFEWYRAFPQDEQDNGQFSRTKLTMPVLALGGEVSAGAGELLLMQSVAFDVRGGVVKQAGHWVVEEQPEVVNNQLAAFLAGQL